MYIYVTCICFITYTSFSFLADIYCGYVGMKCGKMKILQKSKKLNISCNRHHWSE